MSRTIWVPDYGDSSSLYMPMEIPEPGEPGYISPADRLAFARPGDPLPAIIAREQAIEEALASMRAAEPSAAAASARLEDPGRAAEPVVEREAELSGESPVVRPGYLGWTAEPEAGAEHHVLADADLAAPEPGAEAEADWLDEWDSADSNAYQARVEAGLEPEAEL